MNFEGKQSSLLTFRVGPVLCCAPSLPVRTIITPPKLTHVAGSEPSQPGIFKHGPHIVKALDLRLKFGVAESEQTQPGNLIVCIFENEGYAFWVDQILDVFNFPMQGWGNLPPAIPRGVFSKTLLFNNKIHLYCEFEKLTTIHDLGYLKHYIQQLTDKTTTQTVADKNKTLSSAKAGKTLQTDDKKTSASQPSGSDVVKTSRTEEVKYDKAPHKASNPDVTPGASTSLNEEANRSSRFTTTANQTSSVRKTHLESASVLKQANTKPEITRSNLSPGTKTPVSRSAENYQSANSQSSSTKSVHAQSAAATTNSTINNSTTAQHKTSSRTELNTAGTINTASNSKKLNSPTPPSFEEGTDEQSFIGVAIFFILLLLLPAAGYYFFIHETATQIRAVARNEITPTEFTVTKPQEISSPTISEALTQQGEIQTTENEAIETPDLTPVVDIGVDARVETTPADSASYRADISEQDNEIMITIHQTTSEETLPEQPQQTVTTITPQAVAVDIDIDTEAIIEPSPVETLSEQELNTTLPRAEPINEIIHTVVKGDTLWAIAKKYVHNPFLYPELARLSNIKNPHRIYPGNRVRIRFIKD